MTELRFTAIIEPDDEGFHAFVPGLPGCHTFGSTVEEARQNLIEAVGLHIETMRDDGLDVPVGREFSLVTTVVIPQAS